MNRHSKEKIGLLISGLFALVVFCFWSAQIHASTMPFQEGVQYKKYTASVYDAPIMQDLIKQHPNKVQVLEFYSYACHWCQHIEPKIGPWSKTLPESAIFHRIPVNFQPSWRALSKIYFAAENMKIVDKIHLPMFKAIQEQQLSNTKDETILNFVVKQGIDKKAFNEAYHSFAVENKIRWANNLAVSSKITAIPTLVVIGPKEAFYTQMSFFDNETQMIEVLNFLIKQQSNLLKLKKS